MTVFIAILLTAAAFAVIIYPFFRQRLRPVDSSEDENLQELHSKRDTAYSMLKELEFDYQSGILTEEDYQDLEARYKRKAISILRDVDGLENGAGEDEIEKQVLRQRRKGRLRAGAIADLRKGTEAEDEIEKQVRELRRGKGRFCSQCGVRYQDDDRFCSSCGANLREGKQVD